MTNAEKNQLSILTTVIDSLDFDQFQVRALRVLDENAHNKFALMVYNADIHPISHCGKLIGVTFDEYEVEHYLSESAWAYGLDPLLAVTKLVVMKERDDDVVDARLHIALFKSAHMVCKDPQSLLLFYDCLVSWLCNSSVLQWVSDYSVDFYLADQARSILGSRITLARAVVEQLKVINGLSVEKRKLLALQLKRAGLLPNLENGATKKKMTIFGVAIGAVCVSLACILLAMLL